MLGPSVSQTALAARGLASLAPRASRRAASRPCATLPAVLPAWVGLVGHSIRSYVPGMMASRTATLRAGTPNITARSGASESRTELAPIWA